MVALAYGAGSLAVFLAFGAWLLKRMVLAPLDELSRTADALAEGSGPVPEQSFEGREFKALEERFRAMAQRLLDAQGQVVRAEKLAAIGRLSAGLAHEIRNPLGALNTYVEVLKQRGVDAEVVDAMQQEVARMDHIVAGLLDYARTRGGARVPRRPRRRCPFDGGVPHQAGGAQGARDRARGRPRRPGGRRRPARPRADPRQPDPQRPRRPPRWPDRRRGCIVTSRGRGAGTRTSTTQAPAPAARIRLRHPVPRGGTPVDGTLLIVADEGGGRAGGGPDQDLRSLLHHQGPG